MKQQRQKMLIDKTCLWKSIKVHQQVLSFFCFFVVVFFVFLFSRFSHVDSFIRNICFQDVHREVKSRNCCNERW